MSDETGASDFEAPFNLTAEFQQAEDAELLQEETMLRGGVPNPDENQGVRFIRWKRHLLASDPAVYLDRKTLMRRPLSELTPEEVIWLEEVNSRFSEFEKGNEQQGE